MFEGIHSLDMFIKSVHQLSMLLDHMDDGILIADYQGNVLFMNSSARTLVRRMMPKISHSIPKQSFDFIPGNTNMDIFEVYLKEALEKQKLYKNEKMELYVDEKKQQFLVSTQLIYSCSNPNKLLGVVLMIKNDNHQRQLLDDCLSDTFSVIGQIAAGVAHEIRNPLTAVFGYLQLAIEEMEGHKLQKKFEKIVLPELNHTLEILNEFIYISNPSASSFKTTKVENLFQLVISKITHFCLNQNINFHLNVDQNIPPVLVDIFQMKQVIWQIAKNGIESMPYGGVLQFNVKYLPVTNYILIQTLVTGISMDKSNMQYSIYAHIIENHGGHFEINDIKGEGTRISIYLPPATE